MEELSSGEAVAGALWMPWTGGYRDSPGSDHGMRFRLALSFSFDESTIWRNRSERRCNSFERPSNRKHAEEQSDHPKENSRMRTSLPKSVSAKPAATESSAPESDNSGPTPKVQSRKQINAAQPQATPKAGVTQRKPTKQTRNRVPPPQRERILQKYAAGKSIAEISSEEKRNRETIGKIVNGPEIGALVQSMREELFGLCPSAISTIEHCLTKERDGRLAFQILAHLGVFPSPAEIQSLVPRPKIDEDTEIKKFAVKLVEGAIERHRFFGLPFPGDEEYFETHGGKTNGETAKSEPVAKKTTKNDHEHTPE